MGGTVTDDLMTQLRNLVEKKTFSKFPTKELSDGDPVKITQLKSSIKSNQGISGLILADPGRQFMAQS